jgi:hypothetical protein
MRTRASLVVFWVVAGAAAGQDEPRRLPSLGPVEPPPAAPPAEVEPAQYVRPVGGPAPGPIYSGGPEVVDPAVPVVKVQVRIPKDAAPGVPVKCQVYVTNVSAAEAYDVRLRVPTKGLNAQITSANPKADGAAAGATDQYWTVGKLKGNTQEKD